MTQEGKRVNAYGVKGCLLRTDDIIYFRVYDDKGDFIDYDIVAHDISVEVTDKCIELVSKGNKHYIDHSAKVFGRD